MSGAPAAKKSRASDDEVAWERFEADRMNRLGTETAFVVLSKAKALEAQGRSVLHFEIGEPDFDTPAHIIEAGVQALQNGETHYTPSAGTMAFRTTICEHVQRTRNVGVTPDRVVAVPGAKPVIFFTMLATLQPGDEVLMPNPGFPIYESMANFCGAIAVPYKLEEARNFRFDPAEMRRLCSPSTAMIIINSPQNPTGGILTSAELQLVAELAAENDCLVLADEIYDEIMYDGQRNESIMSLPGMAERTILLAGHSKNYAMTGWRLGYGVYPNADMAAAVSRLATNSTSCVAAFTQVAGAAALAGPHDEVRSMVDEFQRRRDFIVAGLNEMGLRCSPPEGAFYVLAAVEDAGLPAGMGSAQFADYLLQEAGVAVLDGSCFGKYGVGYIRLSYATSMENITEGLNRIRGALAAIHADAAAVPARYIQPQASGIDVGMLDDVAFMTSMLLCTMCNYAQTGHYGGPLSYTPANVAMHLLGTEHGGLAYDVRAPKHPLTDKFMLTGGHCIPTCYALWIIMYEAMERQHQATGDARFQCDPNVGMYAIDALGFRRSPGACETLLADAGVADHPVMAQAGVRGVRALMGHSETTDVTNDVNGGPSGIGFATTAGKALFFDAVGAPEDLKVVAFEGEFALTEGHAQELKTLALAQQVGKRLRLFCSFNDAGIDDSLTSGVVPAAYSRAYNLAQQFESYGWNVFELRDGADMLELAGVFKTMEDWDASDRRPMVVVAKTVKGWWPAAADGQIRDVAQIVGHKSHPYGHAMNGAYFQALAGTFEERYGVAFQGLADGAPADEAARLVQCKTNVDVVLSVLDANGGALRQKLAAQLLAIAEDFQARRAPALERIDIAGQGNPFADGRLRLENLPREPQTVSVTHPTTGEQRDFTITLFQEPGAKKGTRRAISEIGKWCNFVTQNRWVTIAADLSGSINVEGATLTGHYAPDTNPRGTRLKAGIQECANAATMCGLVSATTSVDPAVHEGLWGVCGTYGAFTPLFLTPMRILSQQNQESPFALGVVTLIVGHSGPETAADGRSHFGIFAPQCWTLFPRNQIINIYAWDYNDVAPAYFAAVQRCNEVKETAIIALHVARPDAAVADRNTFADSDPLAAAKGAYVIRDYADGQPQHGTVLLQGCSSTFNAVAAIPQLEAAGINVRMVAVISQELYDAQPQEYRDSVMSPAHRMDCMVVTTMTKRIMPLNALGPLTEEYTMSSDFDDRWRTGGKEADVIAEAHLDVDSIVAGITRFANDREERLGRLRASLGL